MALVKEIGIRAVFNFVAGNPPMALIVGRILLMVLSALTAPFNVQTTLYLRESGQNLVILGVFLQILYLTSSSQRRRRGVIW